MKYVKDFRNLCTPASVYLAINVVIFVVIAVQNFGNTKQYCVGQYKCNVPNTFVMFLFKAVYILFWTFLLNAVCKAGYKEVSWFLVLLPIILMFVILGMVLINMGAHRVIEGYREGKDQDPTTSPTTSPIPDPDTTGGFKCERGAGGCVKYDANKMSKMSKELCHCIDGTYKPDNNKCGHPNNSYC